MSVDLIRYDLLVQDALRGVVRRVLTDVARDGLPGDHHLYVSFDTTAPGVRLSPRLKERYPEEMTIVLQHQFWDLILTEEFFEVGLSFNGIPERLHIPFASLKGFFDPSVKFGLQFEPMPMDEEADEDAPATTLAPVTPIGEARLSAVKSDARKDEAEVEASSSKDSASKSSASTAEPKPAPASATPKAAPRSSVPRTVPAKSAGKAAEPAVAQEAKPSAKSPEPKSASPKGKEASVDEAEAREETSGGAQVVRLDAFRKK